MNPVALLATGTYLPEAEVTNEALVAAYNTYAQAHNAEHAQAIAAGTMEAKPESSAAFVAKASGILSRRLCAPEGVLDPQRMRPTLPYRDPETLSLTAEMMARSCAAFATSHPEAWAQVGLVLVACSNPQRPYPGVSVELQKHLGLSGVAFDMQAACSSMTFGMQVARQFIQAGTVRAALVLGAELASGQLNFTERDSHFIFGDGAAAVLLAHQDLAASGSFALRDVRIQTSFSNTIRCNFGYLNHVESEPSPPYFVQEGRRVLKDVVPWVSQHLKTQREALSLPADAFRRLWLHQANRYINDMIAERFYGHKASLEQAPLVLDRYGNTGGVGSIMAFDAYHGDFQAGDLGLLASFGAGYSVGSLVLEAL